MKDLPLDNGNPESGIICAANESRFNAANLSQELTAFTAGWKDNTPLIKLLNFVAPPVAVNRRFEFKKTDNSECFLSEDDDVRAVGSAFKRVEFTGTLTNAKTLNKGLTLRIDHDDAIGEDWRERYVQLIVQRLYRNELKRALAALSENGKKIDKVWNAQSNPDADLRNMLALAANETGVYPNRILFGESAWFLRSDTYDVQQNAGAHRAASLSLTELAQKLFVDEIQTVHARLQTSKTKEKLLGNAVFAFYASDTIVKDEPSNIKRFYTPTDAGSPFRVYVEDHSKFSDLTVEHYSNIIVTAPNGIHQLVVKE
ncbi:MAG: hypothetical protein A2Y14_01825 [Verrucomicrobia bacterium GWF2_51_19]|nr:MAG: hypothetical protein A2Y14_01825 [Verrucomicrobia bacterium GWF2_51_19]HCJ11603.1 hypothetical protein [Opitutae bacterium]